MTEKVGDILYQVYWTFGFGPGDEDWEEGEDVYKASFELETYRIRSVRRRPRGRAPRARLPSKLPKQVTAFQLDNPLTVNAKDQWQLHPDLWLRRQWREGERPRTVRLTKSAAYRAALADMRVHPSFNPKLHQPLLNRIKGVLKRLKI